MNNIAADGFLRSIGKLIAKIDEVKTGDVIGIRNRHQDGQIRLYCVEYVDLNPGPPHLTPPSPYVRLYPTHIGFGVNKNKEIHGFHYLSIPEKGSRGNLHGWSNTTLKEYVDWGIDTESAQEFSDENSFPKFLIEDEKFKKLGEIISLSLMPSFSFIPQSRLRDIHDLVGLVESLQPEFEALRRIQEVIQQKCYKYAVL